MNTNAAPIEPVEIEPVEIEPCAHCEKMPQLCVCDLINPVATKTRVLILQHPQEPDKELGTAKLLNLGLSNSELKIGLSWRSLRALAGAEVDHKRWLVLYLGSAVIPALSGTSPELFFVDGKGKPLEQRPSLGSIDGLVLLDGTWSQAKTLWWRNAWLLKLRRGILRAPQLSKYGKLRKEPRRESLSTLEAASYTLDILERTIQPSETLLPVFDGLLERYRGNKTK